MSDRGFWRWTRDGSTAWNARMRVRRLELGFHVYRHTYARSSDRWVVHPVVVYDRKRVAA